MYDRFISEFKNNLYSESKLIKEIDENNRIYFSMFVALLFVYLCLRLVFKKYYLIFLILFSLIAILFISLFGIKISKRINKKRKNFLETLIEQININEHDTHKMIEYLIKETKSRIEDEEKKNERFNLIAYLAMFVSLLTRENITSLYLSVIGIAFAFFVIVPLLIKWLNFTDNKTDFYRKLLDSLNYIDSFYKVDKKKNLYNPYFTKNNDY